MQDSFDLTKLIFGRLSWDAIPFHEPILLGTFAWRPGRRCGPPRRSSPTSACGAPCGTTGFTSIDHKKIGIMYMILGLVMFLRGFADALMMRAQQAFSFGDNARLPAAAPLRPGLHRPRRDHDLLRGDAVRDGPDELRRAAADRRARRRLPVPEQLLVLDDDHGRRAGDGLAVRRRIRAYRLAGLPAAVGHPGQSGCRRRLLHLVIADRGCRHAAVGST
jgi:hypothetical protein